MLNFQFVFKNWNFIWSNAFCSIEGQYLAEIKLKKSWKKLEKFELFLTIPNFSALFHKEDWEEV